MIKQNKDCREMAFSELITELTEMWLLLMKHDKISHNTDLSYAVRRESAEQIESLVKREYLITDCIDKIFEKSE